MTGTLRRAEKAVTDVKESLNLAVLLAGAALLLAAIAVVVTVRS